MKDKSRFMSSLIVSLFAGFIYFLFGQDINENVQSSIRAVLSSNDIEEHYMSAECQSFNSVVDNSGIKSKTKKTKFYLKKRNTIEFTNKDVTVPGDELFSAYIVNQAKLQRAEADKNPNFTAELDLLIKTNETNSGKPVEELNSLKKRNDEVAESRSFERKSDQLYKNFERNQAKGFYQYRKGNAEYKGSGFEYNFVTGESFYQPGASKIEGKSNKIKVTKTIKTVKQRTSVIAPKAEVYINDDIIIDESDCDEDMKDEPVEINNEDSEDQDSM